MLEAARHDVLVLADSDMRVDRRYLAAVSAPLRDPANGIVTCLYKGVSTGGTWSELGAMHINFGFLPSALVAEALGLGGGCFGATIALRRETLEADRRVCPVAQRARRRSPDRRGGARRSGLPSSLSAYIVEARVTEPSFADLWQHELRWARTVRAVAPAGFAGSVLAHPVAISAAAAALAGFGLTPCIFVLISCVLRWATARAVAAALGLSPAKPWLLPVRDALSFAVFVASFFGRTVFWRDQAFRVDASGRMTARRRQGPMMKTLFLHPPSFDGFDGGAGSRYQAKREIRSFWYPTWLAQPAALVPDSKLIDAPPARLKLDDVLPWARDYELAVLHTSTPSFASDLKVAEALKEMNPRLKIGMVGAKVAVEPDGQPQGVGGSRVRCPRGIRFHDQGGRRRAALRCDRRPELSRPRGQSRSQPRPGGPRRHGPAALRHRNLQARFAGRRLLHRLSEAPLRVALHRARLPVEMHLLPVAADRRRASLPGAQRRPRDRRDPPREELFPAGEGVLFRRRHFHRRPAARRGDRPRARQARRDLVVQRQGQRAARDTRRCCATTGCGCCWSATRPATSRS